MKRLARLLFSILLVTLPGIAPAAVGGTVIPEPLAPWRDWVLRDQPAQGCPELARQPGHRHCLWPGVLEIALVPGGATFHQRWDSLADGQWLMLPGDAGHWPRAVTLDGAPAPVIERDGRPALAVGPGAHEVAGQFVWEQPPQSLAVDPGTALVNLRRDGAEQRAELDAGHRLWLRAGHPAASAAADSLRIEVFRRLDDAVPLRLHTELRLTVTGSAREILVGQLLPAESETIALESPLPARIEADGRLRVQMRPGVWRLLLDSRYTTAPTRFAAEPLDPQWPAQEIWTFRADPNLRGVRLGGAPAVDPARLDLPPDFAGLPTHLVTSDAPLTLTEDYRGDANPAAARLHLDRALWLDFDGSGATVRDRISGSLSQGWRLQAAPTLALGRVAIDGVPEVVTQVPGLPGAGVEVRATAPQVETIGRLARPAAGVIGWEHDFEQVGIALNLPPGWQLWHASGPDQVQTSWLSRWNLWDLFLCLLIVGATLRILDWRWSLVAAAMLALTYQEPGAPIVGWVALVAAIPLLRVLPAGRARDWLRIGAGYALVLLVLAALGFAVQQVRAGLYPQLERSGPINPGYGGYDGSLADAAGGVSAPMMESTVAKMRMDAPAPRPRYEPDEQTQTGPGEPTWHWHQVTLGWNGPVRSTETVQLWLSPPWLTRSLKFLQVALVSLFLYALGAALWRAGKLPGGGRPARGHGSTGAAGIAAVLLAVLVGGAPDAAWADSFPSPELLEQLKAELLRPPACAPECTSLLEARLDVEANGIFLLRLRAAAAAPAALPLPPPAGWQPVALLRDGAPAPLARIDGAPWVAASAGVRELILRGEVRGDSADFRFPLPPRLVTVNAPGWQVDGLDGTRLRGDTLQVRRAATGERASLLPDPAPAFVSVERRLVLDLDWQLTTTITRIAPLAGAINLSVPLLPSETVIGEQPLTAAGEMPVTLNPGQQQMQWRSQLPLVAELALAAPPTAHWVEVWRVEASPRWHVAGAGLPAVKTPGSVHSEWRPWPGERLTLSAVRPEPVAGPAVTIESAALTQRTGARGAGLTLALKLRSSLGGDYRLRLPVAGKLQRVAIDGVEQTRPEQDGEVVIPLHPGLQTAAIEWQLDRGAETWITTPPLVLPTPATNIDLVLQVPGDRWPLWLRGPDIGPAMLYWGVLLVVVGVAIALGVLVRRLGLSIPATTAQWLLLGIGMSTVNSAGSVIVVLWFFALEARRRWTPPARPALHNLVQLGLFALTLAAAACLAYTIPQSLLAAPDMQVVGNGSSHLDYRWYQDRAAGALPTGAVLSLPLWLYRLAMLAWSLWLVFALLRWVRWGWDCLGTGVLWRRGEPRRKQPIADDPPVGAP
jgi:hypothetical protein